MNALDKFTAWFAPKWTVRRIQARAALRYYNAASGGRRTEGWRKTSADADTANKTTAKQLRDNARDLVRNNGWARRAVGVVVNNTVGWGLRPKPIGLGPQAMDLWRAWADSPRCETEGLLTFTGVQRVVMATLAVSGECIVRRRARRPTDGLVVPLQLQVLEPDYIDANKNVTLESGGYIVQGVEFDAIGRRSAYWLFDGHPGGSLGFSGVSRRVVAEDVIHIVDVERPEQTRGVSWLASGIVQMKDLDDLEDAELMKQKIAACFAAFVTDTDGTGPALGEQSSEDELVETFEPGMIRNLPAGKQVTFATPPTAMADSAAQRALRKFAAGLGITYEDLTGDYSQVNFSSARMGRLAHWANVSHWQNDLLIPLLCQPVWQWFLTAALLGSASDVGAKSQWIAPAMPMIEPDKEGIAAMRQVRSGLMTPSQMVRSQGLDPDEHWQEYADDMKQIDELELSLDFDVRTVTQQGQAQAKNLQSVLEGEEAPAAGGFGAPAKAAEPEATEPEGDDVDMSDEEEKPAPKRYDRNSTLRVCK